MTPGTKRAAALGVALTVAITTAIVLTDATDTGDRGRVPVETLLPPLPVSTPCADPWGGWCDVPFPPPDDPANCWKCLDDGVWTGDHPWQPPQPVTHPPLPEFVPAPPGGLPEDLLPPVIAAAPVSEPAGFAPWTPGHWSYGRGTTPPDQKKPEPMSPVVVTPNLVPPAAPVPEPGTWLMMIAGFAFVAGGMRRMTGRRGVRWR